MSTIPSSLGINEASQRVGPSNTGSPLQLEINIDLCRVILHLGDQPSFTVLKDLIYFLLDAFLYRDTDSSAAPSASGSVPAIPLVTSACTRTPFVGYSGIQFGRIASQIKEALKSYWQAETKAKNNGFDDGAHVILILDKHLQAFPWESCPVLREEAVSRVPSMWFLRDRILQQQYFSSSPSPSTLQETFGTIGDNLEVDPHKTFYILNPAGDLKNTEEEFKGYVESQEGWDGVIGRAPMDMECIDGLSKNDLYIYFGHSGGEQYIKSTQLRQLGRCAVSILLGCSSGSLKSEGDFDPTGNAMNYLLAGCPTLVANLWDVTDKDLDRFSMAMFNLWGLEDNRSDPKLSPRHTDTSKAGRKLRLSLVEAVKEAREECRMKYLVGAASVVYGIPCYLK
ncbi:MAG: putative Separin [Benniella sp.]|nr:MAG: putative Separin [Benniella sp.]